MNKSHILLTALVSISLLSCTRRTLDIPTNGVTMVLDNDYTLPCEAIQSAPYHYDILFYDTVTGSLVNRDFCREEGGPVTAGPGTYTVFAYNLDLKNTLITGENDIRTLTALSGEVKESEKELFRSCQMAYVMKTKADGYTTENTKGYPGFENDNVIEEPDPLFAGFNRKADIPHLAVSDKEYSICVHTESALCQEHITLYGIKNTQYIARIEIFITNLASSRNLFTGEPDEIPATIRIKCTDISEEKVEGTINHFGRIHAETTKSGNAIRNTAYIIIYDIGGSKNLVVEDITPQVQQGADGSEIEIRSNFVTPVVSNGDSGMIPETEDWCTVLQSVKIGNPNN